MRYDEPATRQALAAEYVLGTLKGPARRRFERLMAQRPDWREEVERWSTRLAGLAETVPPQEPPPSVWSGIQARIDPAPARRRAPIRWWKPLAAAASLAAIVLAIMLTIMPDEPTLAPQVSVLKDDQARTGWVVTVSEAKEGGTQLRVVVETARPIPGKSFELWLLPGEGAAPVSLGLLPAQGEAVLNVPLEISARLQAGKTLAVSIEPPGGSTVGQPTGPVVYQGQLIAL